ncbi:MAG: hypothetical protein JO119_20155 [Acidobacteria bacterium]|nr:hypothetical protein [Acidobacteriota bacterium]
MATAVVTLDAWSIEYHETMAAAERARQDVEKWQERAVRLVAEVFLYWPFAKVTGDTEKLIGLLEKLESYPSSIFLEDRAASIPASLHELFRTMCVVIQEAEECGLHNGMLKKNINKLRNMSQQVNGFALRFEDAQIKLVSRVPADQVAAYQDSFAAYRNASLVAEDAAEDDDKSELLHF